MATVREALETAVSLHQAGEFAAAETLYRRIIAAAADTAPAWHYLGLLFGQRGRMEDCGRALARAVALTPTQADSYRQSAKVFAADNARGAAFAAWRACARLAPDDAEALHGAGVAALAQGDAAGAAPFLTRAATLSPERIGSLQALAGLLTDGGAWRDTAPVLRTWTVLAPAEPEAWDLAGVVAVRTGDAAGAVAHFQRLTVLSPQNDEAWANLARVRRAAADYAGAERALQRAAALDPAEPATLHDLAGLSLNLTGAERAAVWVARTERLAPERADTAWLAINVGLYCDDVDTDARFARYRRFATEHLKERAPDDDAGAAGCGRAPHHRLRVGYVSADLRGTRPVSRNMEPLIAAGGDAGHDVYFYADIDRPDATSARFAGMAAGWRLIRGVNDDDVARMISADGIDVLVFLASHFDSNRIALATLRAAPVQISFHDVATSGLKSMDYLIADRLMVDRAGAERFTERVLRLPHYYLSAPLADAPSPGPPPRLASGRITFGCCNNPAKLSDATLDLWGRLLIRLPDARLMLKYLNRYAAAAGRQRVVDRLAAAGVAADRILFPDDRATASVHHLDLYNQIDVALDPFPFSGSTTSFEALYMGVPVVTLAQDRMVGRWTASMLDALKLNDLITRSADKYVDTAVAVAVDVDRLRALRRDLRDRVLTSPLCDARRKAREINRLYHAVWRRRRAQDAGRQD